MTPRLTRRMSAPRTRFSLLALLIALSSALLLAGWPARLRPIKASPTEVSGHAGTTGGLLTLRLGNTPEREDSKFAVKAASPDPNDPTAENVGVKAGNESGVALSVKGPMVVVAEGRTAISARSDSFALSADGKLSFHQAAFTHRATRENSSDNVTTVNHPHCNDNPTAYLMVTPKKDPLEVAVYYDWDAARWKIVINNHELLTPKAEGREFNVLVIALGSSVYYQ